MDLPAPLPQTDHSQTAIPRRVYLRKEVEMQPRDKGGYGLTDGCPGCAAIRAGGPARGHSEACRRRVEEEMVKGELDAARVQRAHKRRLAMF
eukprot:4439537-Amphidinium_carterae.1